MNTWPLLLAALLAAGGGWACHEAWTRWGAPELRSYWERIAREENARWTVKLTLAGDGSDFAGDFQELLTQRNYGDAEAAGALDCTPWIAKAVGIQGQVETRHADETRWQPVRLEQTFCGGDMIRVSARSHAAILLRPEETSEETTVQLEQGSTLVIPKLAPSGPRWLELLKDAANSLNRTSRSLKSTAQVGKHQADRSSGNTLLYPPGGAEAAGRLAQALRHWTYGAPLDVTEERRQAAGTIDVRLEAIGAPGAVFHDTLAGMPALRDRFTDGSGLAPQMVVLPGGTFQMGCLTGDRACQQDEQPAHPVTIEPFAIGRTR